MASRNPEGERIAASNIDQSWCPSRSQRFAGERELRKAIENRVLELTDIVESPGQKRDHAFQALKAIASSFQDLGEYAPHPLMVELMLWKADIFFHMAYKNYARPEAKIALLRAIRELK